MGRNLHDNLRSAVYGESRTRWGKFHKALFLTAVFLFLVCMRNSRQAAAAGEAAQRHEVPGMTVAVGQPFDIGHPASVPMPNLSVTMAGSALRTEHLMMDAQVLDRGSLQRTGATWGTWESLQAFARDSFAGRSVRILYADLTHDGTDELITLELKGDGPDYKEADVVVFRRDVSGEVYAIYERTIDSTHAGWGWLYLYEENGVSYLLEYDPVLYEGTSRYSYSVFSLTADGGRAGLAGQCLDFEWDGTDSGRALEDQIRALHAEASAYMERSQVIAAMGDEYFSGTHACDFVGNFK